VGELLIHVLQYKVLDQLSSLGSCCANVARRLLPAVAALCGKLG
jgi:hypothetical protein